MIGCSSHAVSQLKQQDALFSVSLQRQSEEGALQRTSHSDSSVQLQSQIPTKTNHTGLPRQLKSGIESLSGMAMDHVKVHYNSTQPAQLNALAYAQGSDIHLAPGQEQHLPHEAWHVVQQAQGRVNPTLQMKEGVPVNDDAGLEHEADVMGVKALQMKGTGAEGVSSFSDINSSRAPVQRKLLLDSDDSKFLSPEYLQTELKIVPPQLYKTLFYALDDAAENFAVRSSTPGNFDPATKMITIPGHGLEFVVERLTGVKSILGGEKERFATAIAQLSHEMQHAFDYVLGGKKVGLDNTSGTEARYLAVMDTELRAWATEAIAYKKLSPNIDQGGLDLLHSWDTFNPTHLNFSDDALKPNLIWARILQYSTTNKIGDLAWRVCARTGNVLSRAVEEQRRVADFVDIQAAPEAEVTIDTLDDLNVNHGELKAGGNRVRKLKAEGDYRFYLFRRRAYKVRKSVAVEANCFDLATGSFVAPVEDVVEEAAAVEIQLDTLEDINIKAPELKAARDKISKVSKEGEYRIYAFEGRHFKVHASLIDSTYFDQATGVWPVREDVPVDDVVDEAAAVEVQLDTLEDINIKAPELKTARSKISKVSKEGEYRIYAFDSKQFKVHGSLLDSTYFDQATGAWPV